MFESTGNQYSEVGRDHFMHSELDFWRSGPSIRERVQPDVRAWEAGSPFHVTPGQMGIALLTIGLLVIVLAMGIL